jgi:hypothetical protein
VPPTLVAVSDKTGRYLQCGRPRPGGGTCGAKLALYNVQTNTVWFDPGWRREGDLWQLTRRALSELKADQVLASGNPKTRLVIGDDEQVDEARRRLSENKATRYRRSVKTPASRFSEEKVAQARLAAALPLRAKCWKCQAMNRLEGSGSH